MHSSDVGCSDKIDSCNYKMVIKEINEFSNPKTDIVLYPDSVSYEMLSLETDYEVHPMSHMTKYRLDNSSPIVYKPKQGNNIKRIILFYPKKEKCFDIPELLSVQDYAVLSLVDDHTLLKEGEYFDIYLLE